MDSLYVPSDPSFLRFNPLTLLAQVAGQKLNGCLMVYSGSKSWRLYLEDGELVYASAAEQAFDRLERHLRQLGRSVPSLVSAVRVQVRLLFETRQPTGTSLSPDYQAIQWLTEQQYLTPGQAAGLVEKLAKESIQSLLNVSTGNYDIVDRSQLDDWFSVCRLNLQQLVHASDVGPEASGMPPRLGVLEGGALPSSTPAVSVDPNASHPVVEAQSSSAAVEANGSATTSPQDVQLPQTGANATSLVSGNNADNPASTLAFQAEPLSQAPASPSSSVPPLGQAAPTSRSEPYRVVCVDDSPSILKLIHRYLEEEDFSVFMINDPVRALMQVVRCKPDLVLLDVEMPNLDGYELCSLLRRHPAFKTIPIVMVTGNTGFLDRARAKLVGASGYLTKPFDRSELLKVVFRNLPV